MNQNSKYNKRTVFEEEIAPLVSKIEEICHSHRISMFMSYAVYNDEDRTEYHTNILQPIFFDKELCDDKFTDLLNVMNGFKTYYDDKNISEDFDFSQIVREMSGDDDGEY